MMSSAIKRYMGVGGKIRRALFAFMALGAAVAVWPEAGGARQSPAAGGSLDPIVRLQERLDRGEVRLEYTEPRGYLDSLLEALDIPPASQTLVFSKTSLQSSHISPDAPRALYFNDDVYIGWVRDGDLIEVASVDAEQGTVFYTLFQGETDRPVFEREGMRCISCHLPSRSSSPVPRLMVMSVLPSSEGAAVGVEVLLITDESPMNQRWGGWYVTADRAGGMHRGNMIIDSDRGPGWGIGEALNLTDLDGRFDPARYLREDSDIVPLMLLVHQSHVHNLMGDAAHAVRTAVEEERTLKRRMNNPDPAPTPRTLNRVAAVSEPLVRALLFSGAAVFSEPIQGSSSFAEEFMAAGVRDRQGRSLRDLDLDHRLLRYPLSYLVYTESFDRLPELVLDYVANRFRDILGGNDLTPEFDHLNAADRTAILEILRDTKPDFARRLE